jgi:serine/threonine protein kinase
VMARRNSFDWPTRLLLYRQVVSAVHQMHLTKVVHRDIKSANGLMFETTTPRPVVKLGDLGRSRDCGASSSLSPAAYVMGRGDPSFAPPEYFWHLGADDSIAFRRADLYMLGSILFEFATGQGITAVALPDWASIASQAATVPEADRPREFKARIGGLRSRYKAALDLLQAELPAPIRSSGVALVRQLCDPDPAAREHRLRAERKSPDWGLEWVFRRVDILAKSLSASQGNGYRRGRKAG